MARRPFIWCTVGCLIVGVSTFAVGCRFDAETGLQTCDACDEEGRDARDSGELRDAGADTQASDATDGAGADTMPSDTGSPPDTAAEETREPSRDCNYQGKAQGVCGGADLDEDGRCQQPAAFEDAETSCDGRDNDCDGETDEVTESCYPSSADGTPGTGICEQGTRRCESGSWSDCEGAVTAEAEGPANCRDGNDNDCDGSVDAEDSDCSDSSAPGAECQSDSECRSGVCIDDGSGHGHCAHRIFVTSQKWDGDLGGVSGADAKCQNTAESEGLDGNWRAVVSDTSSGTNVRDRIHLHAPVVNMQAQTVADSGTDLWNGMTDLDHPVKFDETGRARKVSVWTGSTSFGYSSDDCGNGWTSSGQYETGRRGDVRAVDGDWLDDWHTMCDEKLALYCIDGQ